MSANLLNGTLVATQLKTSIKHEVLTYLQQGLNPPGLAVILIGQDAASAIYVAGKRRACEAVGFHSFAYNLPSNTSERELLTLIDTLNEDHRVHGILVQLPLPAHMNIPLVIERIKPAKDVDGFHPYNLGRLAQGNPSLRPCTPKGIISLLTHYGLTLSGRHAVIVGASNIVGRPMALECLHSKATVTICHSLTKNLSELVRMAALIVVAVGKTNVINTDWLNDSQILVDVGQHRREDGSIHGDVDFDKACKKVAWITPVPGGVGPMTIATLLQNTLEAYKLYLVKSATPAS